MAFSFSKVRDRVLLRLAAIRHPNEDHIHEAYQREINAENEEASKAAAKLAGLLDERLRWAKVRHPEQGWVMLSREDVDNLIQAANEFTREVNPYIALVRR